MSGDVTHIQRQSKSDSFYRIYVNMQKQTVRVASVSRSLRIGKHNEKCCFCYFLFYFVVFSSLSTSCLCLFYRSSSKYTCVSSVNPSRCVEACVFSSLPPVGSPVCSSVSTRFVAFDFCVFEFSGFGPQIFSFLFIKLTFRSVSCLCVLCLRLLLRYSDTESEIGSDFQARCLNLNHLIYD